MDGPGSAQLEARSCFRTSVSSIQFSTNNTRLPPTGVVQWSVIRVIPSCILKLSSPSFGNCDRILRTSSVGFSPVSGVRGIGRFDPALVVVLSNITAG